MKDNLIIAGFLLLMLAFVGLLGWWMWFYFTHCAFVPLVDLPGICLAARSGS